MGLALSSLDLKLFTQVQIEGVALSVWTSLFSLGEWADACGAGGRGRRQENPGNGSSSSPSLG